LEYDTEIGLTKHFIATKGLYWSRIAKELRVVGTIDIVMVMIVNFIETR
jgi:hypothetical protein